MNVDHSAFLVHLAQADPILHEIAAGHGELTWPKQRPHLEAMVRAIVGQQLSTRAAATIFDRVHGLFSGRDITAQGTLALSTDALRNAGLSQQKVRYMQAVAAAWIAEPGLYGQLHNLSDEAVVEALTRITGVGVWTAQMFLMFTLRRPDVFAPNDLGLKKAMANLYGLAMADSNQKFDAFAQRWSPYRSWASLHLWESLKPR